MDCKNLKENECRKPNCVWAKGCKRQYCRTSKNRKNMDIPKKHMIKIKTKSKTKQLTKIKEYNPKDYSEVVQFYSKSKVDTKPKNGTLPEWRLILPEWKKILSNFSSIDITIDSKVYPSLEHYFHAAKALHSNNPELAILFEKGNTIGNQSPLEAKKAGGRKSFEKYGAILDIEKWNKNRDHTIYKALLERSKVDKTFRDILINTYHENYYLLHFERSGKKSYWGGSIEKDTGNLVGENKHGKMLMMIREEIVKKR